MQRQCPHGVNRLHARRARTAPRRAILSTVDIIECDERSLVVLEAHHFIQQTPVASRATYVWLNSLTNRQDCQEVVSSVTSLKLRRFGCRPTQLLITLFYDTLALECLPVDMQSERRCTKEARAQAPCRARIRATPQTPSNRKQ